MIVPEREILAMKHLLSREHANVGHCGILYRALAVHWLEGHHGAMQQGAQSHSRHPPTAQM